MIWRNLLTIVIALCLQSTAVIAQTPSSGRASAISEWRTQVNGAEKALTDAIPQSSKLLPLGDGGATPGEGTVSGRIFQLATVITALSVAPTLLIMVTSFTRFLIAFSFLRSGLGLQGAPANIVLITLALFMTFFVMAPTFEKAWETGGRPLVENKISEQEALRNILKPFEEFMLANVREKELKTFQELAIRKSEDGGGAADGSLRVLIPAFIVSELRRGFEIGFLILLPFLVIDLLVATLVMSMGMMMVSPTVFSLPLKVLFFVSIDGWNLIVSGLVKSFV